MIEDYFFTKNIKWVLWGAFTIIVALLIFHAGVVVGQHQPHARMVFTNGGPGAPLGGLMPNQGFVEDGHGAVGTIATITPPTFILQSRDGMSEKIYAGTSTMVTGGSLKSGEVIIVVGDPDDTDDGYLDARIIHILP